LENFDAKTGKAKKKARAKKPEALPNEEEIDAARLREHLEKEISVLTATFGKNKAKRHVSNQRMTQENIELTG
jgi:hypothetical protein